MELQDLVGKRVLTGVDCVTEDIPNGYSGDLYHGEVIRFVLDGVTYVAFEDEDDGYRSSMRDIAVTTVPVQNMFVGEEVVGTMRHECGYGTADVLRLISVNTGKVVLEVGTDNTDDYYPSFVASWSPENLSANHSEG